MPFFEVSGHDKVMRKLARTANIDKEVDEVVENSMKRVQLGSFKKAPVKTGYLSSNLIADENRVRTSGVKSGSWDLKDGTDYTLVQEYTNPNGKKFFLRNSVDDEDGRLDKDLVKVIEGKWKS